jgi:hypothetical protein
LDGSSNRGENGKITLISISPGEAFGTTGDAEWAVPGFSNISNGKERFRDNGVLDIHGGHRRRAITEIGGFPEL